MIPTLPFGRTGHQSTRALFGAAALSDVKQEVADQAMETVIHYGVNHIDVAASYGDAELRLGPWMEKRRADFFLASKTGERTYQKAYDSIQRSLDRLRTDHLDMIQLHAVIEDEEWETALGPKGALEACIAAKDKGWVRFIGITSHSLRAPMMHLKSLERYDFDSVLLPYNYMIIQNEQYKADFDRLLQVCRERTVAVQLIKTNQYRKWDDRQHFADTWYEPFTTQEEIDQVVWWALGTQPNTFINSSGDVTVLPKFLDAANRYDPARIPTDLQMQSLVDRTQAVPLWP